jgi:3-hydroxybutyryl-CoA dehydratase
MEKSFFEDCSIGDKVTTSGRTITEADLVLFAAYTGDWLPPHTDAEYARNTLFGERIAHGLLVMAVGSALLLRLGESAFLPKSSIAVHAAEKVRFRAPTRLGDTLQLTSEVTGMAVLDKTRGLLSIRNLIQNQRGQTVVSFTAKMVVGRRPVDGSHPSAS